MVGTCATLVSHLFSRKGHDESSPDARPSSPCRVPGEFSARTRGGTSCTVQHRIAYDVCVYTENIQGTDSPIGVEFTVATEGNKSRIGAAVGNIATNISTFEELNGKKYMSGITLAKE